MIYGVIVQRMTVGKLGVSCLEELALKIMNAIQIYVVIKENARVLSFLMCAEMIEIVTSVTDVEACQIVGIWAVSYSA